jgi:sortase A
MTLIQRLKTSGPVQILGWACLLLGCVGLATTLANLPRAAPKAHIASHILTESSPKPNASEVAAFTVPAGDPRYIAIPAIGLANTPVLSFGLSSDGTIETPNSIYVTGWYSGSSKPGQSGAMFIYGHIASWTKYSIFANLSKLQPGNQILITRGDNTIFRYEVVLLRTYQYNDVDMGQVLSAVTPGDPGLNLMTCAGQVISAAGAKVYSQRLVVFTKQI